MADFHLSFQHPHHRTRATTLGKAPRFQVHLYLFGGKSFSWSTNIPRYHRVWVNSRHGATERRVNADGIPTRMGAKGTWRVDRHFRDLGPAIELAERLAGLTDGSDVAYWASFTESGKFAFQPASHLHPSMLVPGLQGQRIVEDEIVAVEREPYAGIVYDLNIEHLHNYVANGVVVHNSIYSWRGVDVRGLLDFRARHPSGQEVTLDHSHRATRHLVQLANVLSDLLAYRSGLVTDNPAGPAARLLQADDEHAEADFIANQIGSLVERGLLAHPGLPPPGLQP